MDSDYLTHLNLVETLEDVAYINKIIYYLTIQQQRNKNRQKQENKDDEIINRKHIQEKHTYITNKQSNKYTNKFNININNSQTNKQKSIKT